MLCMLAVFKAYGISVHSANDELHHEHLPQKKITASSQAVRHQRIYRLKACLMNSSSMGNLTSLHQFSVASTFHILSLILSLLRLYCCISSRVDNYSNTIPLNQT